MTTKREQLARALHRWGQNNWSKVGNGTWDNCPEADRAAHFRGINAILAELREPDDRMQDAGNSAASILGTPAFSWERIWQSVLDAIGDET